MRKFVKRTSALLCILSSVIGGFGQALAMKGTGAIKNKVVVNEKRRKRRKHRKLRKKNMIGKNVDMSKMDNGKVVEVLEKNQVKKTFAKKGAEWVMNNKGKSLLLGGLLVDSAWRGINEIRLSTIYKKLDKHYENGGCSSSVERYVYRSGNEENSKSLVIKSINRLVPTDYISFWGEQFACKVIPGLAEKNPHLAKIIDYHYGLTHNYVVYEDVGADHDWKNEMENWDVDHKFKWLEDVISQMVNVNLFLFEKGYYHNDFKLDNLSILKDENDKPLVRMFDYGLFGKTGSGSPFLGLIRFPEQFIRLCCQILFGEKHIRAYGMFNMLLNWKQFKQDREVQNNNKSKLFEDYANIPLVKALKALDNRCMSFVMGEDVEVVEAAEGKEAAQALLNRKMLTTRIFDEDFKKLFVGFQR